MTLPVAAQYLASIGVSPWRQTVERAVETVCSCAGQGAVCVDLMCGPGQLLCDVSKRRKDLRLCGVDLNAEYCAFGAKNSPNAEFATSEVIEYLSARPVTVAIADVVTVTAGLHHLEWRQQRLMIELLSGQLAEGATLIIGEICIDGDRVTQRRRQKEVMRYYWGVLDCVLDATEDEGLIAEAIDVLRADLVGEEYKVSLAELTESLRKRFREVQVERVWPGEGQYRMGDNTGEFLLLCRGARKTN